MGNAASAVEHAKQQGNALFAKGDYAGAAALYRKALAGNVQLHALQARATAPPARPNGLRAAVSFRCGAPRSRSARRSSIRRIPPLTCPQANISACCLHGGLMAAALDAADAAIAAKPEWPKGHYRRGSVLAAAGLWHEATLAFTRALAVEPDNKQLQQVTTAACNCARHDRCT